jgi:hypothetical protein
LQGGLADPASGEWCCGEYDCHAVEHNGIRQVPGGFFVAASGETIPQARVIWRSPDGSWWRCLRDPLDARSATRCLIGPPPGS